jgi:hypothetical protein
MSLFRRALSAKSLKTWFQTRNPSIAHTQPIRLRLQNLEGREMPALVTPVWSDRLVDSIGVNTHLNNTWQTTTYGSASATQSALSALGIRHIRSDLQPYYGNDGIATNTTVYNNIGVDGTLYASSGWDLRPYYGVRPILNGGFEAGNTSNWTTSGTTSASYAQTFFNVSPAPDGAYNLRDTINNYTLANWSTSPFSVTNSQTITGTANGNYNISMWVNAYSTPSITLSASGFGGTTKSTTVPVVAGGFGGWQLVRLNNIAIANNQVTVTITTSSSTGNQGAVFDQVLLNSPDLWSTYIVNRAKSFGSALGAISGDNEVDTGNNLGFEYNGIFGIEGVRSYQQALYNAVKNDPVLGFAGRNVPVVSVSFGASNNPLNDPRLANLGNADFGDIHPYRFGGDNPGVDPTFGVNHKASGLRAQPNVPLMATEYGYSSVTGYFGAGLPSTVLAKYALRGVADQFKDNYYRSYIYQLFTDNEGFGLVDSSNNALRSDGVAISKLIGLLKDNSWDTTSKTWAQNSFSGTPLDYSVAAPSTVKHLLTQKSDGYYLLLWNEVQNWNYSNATENTFAPVSVTLTTSGLLPGATAYTFDGTGNYATSNLTFSGTNLTFNVNDAMTIIKLVPNTPKPFLNAPFAIPASGSTTLQAENFDSGGQNVSYYDTDGGNNGGAYRNTDVDIAYTTDGGAGSKSVGWIAANEWMKYTVNVAQAGTYDITARVASGASGGTFRLEDRFGTTIARFTAPGTGGWDTWTNVTVRVNELAVGTQTLRLFAETAGYNIQSLTFARVNSVSAFTVPTIAATGTSLVSPANFDYGGQGVAYNDTDSGNNGGSTYRRTNVDLALTNDSWTNNVFVGWTSPGEWLGYTINVAQAGVYNVALREANGSTSNGTAHLEFGPVGQVGGTGITKSSNYTLTPSGGWDTWRDVTIRVFLKAGTQWMRIVMDTGGYNLDMVKFTRTSAAKLSGTAIGSGGAWNNDPTNYGYATVFDGNLNTFYNSNQSTNGNGNWVGLDLGSAKTVSVIRFAPRIGLASRMVGGKFQVSNSATFASGVVDLYTIGSTPEEGLQSVTVNPGAAYRYVRYLSPNGGWGNIAEMEVWG